LLETNDLKMAMLLNQKLSKAISTRLWDKINVNKHPDSPLTKIQLDDFVMDLRQLNDNLELYLNFVITGKKNEL